MRYATAVYCRLLPSLALWADEIEIEAKNYAMRKNWKLENAHETIGSRCIGASFSALPLYLSSVKLRLLYSARQTRRHNNTKIRVNIAVDDMPHPPKYTLSIWHQRSRSQCPYEPPGILYRHVTEIETRNEHLNAYSTYWTKRAKPQNKNVNGSSRRHASTIQQRPINMPLATRPHRP